VDRLRQHARRFAAAMDPSKPAVDVLESDTDVVVVAEVPGASAEDLTLRVEGEQLTLAARPAEAPEGRVLRAERCHCEWRRRFRLRGVDPEAAEARLEDGLLVVTFPKRANVARRQVDIRTAPGEPVSDAVSTA
jgi:HSP20 family protein